MTQINYVSRKLLHSTPNLNFGSMGKKAKHYFVVNKLFSSVQLIVFLDHVFLIAKIGAQIQISSK